MLSNADIAASIAGGGAPAKLRKLRYTFNTAFRERRLADQLEEESDDEEEVRMGRVEASVAAGSAGVAATAAAAAAAEAADDEDAEDVRLSGVKMGAGKPLGKRDLTSRYADNLRDGSGGLYISDAVFHGNKESKSAHRRRKGKGGAAAKKGTPAFHFWGQSS